MFLTRNNVPSIAASLRSSLRSSQNEVYCIDVAMPTGTGKGREGNDRTTVFKRNVDQTYKLKMKASKYVLNQIQADFPTMPFSLRMVSDERQAKMGVTECVSHNLLSAYPVFNERDGAYVAHFKTTVLVMSSGTKKVTGQELDGYYVSEKGLDEENEALLKEGREAEEKKKAKVRRASFRNKGPLDPGTSRARP